jgi:signal transduction histidine kinase
MAHDAGGIVLTVSDNGIGIPVPARAAVAGLGLFGLRESLAHHDGTLTIEDNPPRGTRLIVRAPVLPLDPGGKP